MKIEAPVWFMLGLAFAFVTHQLLPCGRSKEVEKLRAEVANLSVFSAPHSEPYVPPLDSTFVPMAGWEDRSYGVLAGGMDEDSVFHVFRMTKDGRVICEPRRQP